MQGQFSEQDTGNNIELLPQNLFNIASKLNDPVLCVKVLAHFCAG